MPDTSEAQNLAKQILELQEENARLQQRLEVREDEESDLEAKLERWQDVGKTAIALLASYKMNLASKTEHQNIDSCISKMQNLHPEWGDTS